MNKFFFVAIFVFFGFTCATLAQPKLRLECGETYDWGKVKEKESPLKTKIKIYNDGNKTLVIDTVKPACGCTVASLTKKNVEPGDYTTIDIKLNLIGYGDFLKTVAIVSNDSVNPIKILELKAYIVTPLTFSPSKVFTFPKTTVRTPIESKIKITNISDEPIKIKSIETVPPSVTTSMKDGEVIAPKETKECIVTMNPINPGNISCTVLFYTNHPDLPKVEMVGWCKVIEANKEEKK